MHPKPRADSHASESSLPQCSDPFRQFNQAPRYLQIAGALDRSRTYHEKSWQVGYHKDVFELPRQAFHPIIFKQGSPQVPSLPGGAFQDSSPMNIDSTPRADPPAESSSAPSERDRLSRRERGVWRAALLLLGILALAFSAMSWEAEPPRLEALPVGLVILVFLFVAYARSKTNEISELRGLVRGIEQRNNPAQDHDQLDQLFSLISQSQQGYRDLIDTFEDLLFSITKDGKILTVNRSFADLLNLSFADVVGRRLDEFFDLPEASDRQALLSWLPRFMQRRRWTGVVRARVKQTGELRYFDCVLHAIVRDDAVLGISGFARDVTKERESENRFTELFQTLREGVYLASADDRITEVNPALAQMLGYESKEELLNCEISSLYRKSEDRLEEQNLLNNLGFLRAHEITLKHREGGRDVVAVHTTAAIRDPAGKFVRYQGTFVDVTEQREMERRLHREQEFAGRLMDGFPDLVVALDTEGRYTFVSPQIIDLLGFRPEELIGRKMGSRIDPTDCTAMLEMFDDLIFKRLSEGPDRIPHAAQERNVAGISRLRPAAA